jgi:hypothetical protein
MLLKFAQNLDFDPPVQKYSVPPGVQFKRLISESQVVSRTYFSDFDDPESSGFRNFEVLLVRIEIE